MVEVKFLSRFRDITKERSINIKNNGKMRDLIEILVNNYGKAFKDAIFDKNGDLRDYMKILINGEDLQAIGGLDAEVKDGDEIIIFQTIAGG